MCASANTSPDVISDATLRDMIDGHLAEAAATVQNERLRESVEYALLGGGKRVRPLITLRCAALLGAPLELALPSGCALEMIHAFSLVHDDLPAMDDDDLRRGRPTVHKKFGEAIGILCGDMLHALAFRTAAASTHATEVVKEVAIASGAMIDGQTWDTNGIFPDALTPQERLDLVHRNKTGALIRGAARCGAIAAGADQASLDAIDRWSTAIGLMFQVVDDVLDETQSTDHLGKAAGKDRDAGKLTYPSIHGIEGARKAIDALQDDACSALERFSELAKPLLEMTRNLANRTR